jgi:hypothetical protein
MPYGYILVSHWKHVVYGLRGRNILDSDWCDFGLDMYIMPCRYIRMADSAIIVYTMQREYILDCSWCDIERNVYTMSLRSSISPWKHVM